MGPVPQQAAEKAQRVLLLGERLNAEIEAEGMAHLYPLTDYQPRQGESLVRGYMAGRYGAIPFIPQGLLGKDTSGQVATEGE